MSCPIDPRNEAHKLSCFPWEGGSSAWIQARVAVENEKLLTKLSSSIAPPDERLPCYFPLLGDESLGSTAGLFATLTSDSTLLWQSESAFQGDSSPSISSHAVVAR